MFKLTASLFLLLSAHLIAVNGSMHLSDYRDVAIATDLEPDDVLALKILFQEANALYQEQPESGYPIKLVIAGEGRSWIKKVRMQVMLDSYFNIPKDVTVQVKAGKSTEDNLFPYDGEEIFFKKIYQNYPIPEPNEGNVALESFLQNSDQPLIIQLKPLQELIPFTFSPELSQKTDIIFYGSFNFRKSILDKDVADYFNFDDKQSISSKLQILLDHISHSFKKVGIVESYGVLGEQSSVFHKYSWSHPIAERIEGSNDPFYFQIFQPLVHNWNKYLLETQLNDLIVSIIELHKIFPWPNLVTWRWQLEDLKVTWNEAKFSSLFSEIMDLKNTVMFTLPEGQKIINQLIRDVLFADQLRPSAGLQFTLSDVIVALALIDKTDFFTTTSVKININENGFIVTTPEAESNIFYYDRKNHEEFVEILMSKI